MARRRKSNKKMISIALMVIGAGLLYWGYQMSGSVGSQLSHVFTGSHSDKVMIRYIGGAACFVIGLYMYMRR